MYFLPAQKYIRTREFENPELSETIVNKLSDYLPG